MSSNSADKCVSGPQLPIAYANAYWYRSPERLLVSRKRKGRVPASVMVVILHGLSKVAWKTAEGSGSLQAGPGDVVLWPKHVERVESNDPRKPLVAITIPFEWTPWPEGLSFMTHDQAGVIRALADSLLMVKDAETMLKPQLQNAYLSAMLAEFIRLTQLRVHPLVAKIRFYIETHLEESFTVKDLAAHAGLDPHHFGRRFKALAGRTPMQEARRIRVEHARSTIRVDPRMPLKDVAERAGIHSAGHLGRLFKQVLGVTPRDVRA